MTNPFTGLRQWRMERYFYEMLEVCSMLDIRHSPYQPLAMPHLFTETPFEGALRITREHFNDHTFQPRGKQ